MLDRIVVALAGIYPKETYSQFLQLFSNDKRFVIKRIETSKEYEALTDANCIILRCFKASKEDILRNPNLKLICRWGVGFDSVDIEAAGESGVYVCNTPSANAHAVSEHAIALMLALAHNIVRHTLSLREGVWSKSLFEKQSITLKDKTIGLIGGGSIGRQVAEKVGVFGAKVIYNDVARLSQSTEQEFAMTFVPLEELLRKSDIVSIHVPLTKDNHHMIDKEQFDMMKPGAIVINTARGGLINEKALLDAIDKGHLLGAGIDCTEVEPLEKDNPLMRYANVIITPHVGGTSSDIGNSIIPMIEKNVRKLATGEPFEYVVNQQYIKAEC